MTAYPTATPNGARSDTHRAPWTKYTNQSVLLINPNTGRVVEIPAESPVRTSLAICGTRKNSLAAVAATTAMLASRSCIVLENCSRCSGAA